MPHALVVINDAIGAKEVPGLSGDPVAATASGPAFEGMLPTMRQ